MIVQTRSGNRYSYHRSSNEILLGAEREPIKPLAFQASKPIAGFPDVSTFTIGTTTKCNLRCSYCCYSGAYRNVRSHGDESMTNDDIDDILKFISQVTGNKEVTLDFYGGESLLELSTIKYCVVSAIRHWGDRVHFELSTNGVLLIPSTVNWLVANDFTILLSLDGTKEFHDRQRMTQDGRGTFKKIKDNLWYIRERFPDFLDKKVLLLMTVMDISELPAIAEEWEKDDLLCRMQPTRISSVSPNYSMGVNLLNKEETVESFYRLLDFYVQHRNYRVLKVFFERRLAEWIQRPIFTLDSPITPPTCVPNNRKLYIDTKKDVGICEKTPDTLRIGNTRDGISWGKVNKTANALATIIKQRCGSCVVARFCDVCPAVLDLSDSEMDVYCHNQRIMQEVKFLMFCELAENGLIE